MNTPAPTSKERNTFQREAMRLLVHSGIGDADPALDHAASVLRQQATDGRAIDADPPERFACVKCGKRSVKAPAPVVDTDEGTDPAKPWALSQNDREMLIRFGIKPDAWATT